MDVDWDKPQLKGLAAPDQPILITLPFALDNRVSTASDLGWGIENVPQYHRTVNFIANEQEIHPSVVGSRVSAKVREWQSNLLAGKSLPDEVMQLRTAVSLVLPDRKGGATNHVYIVFESDLNSDENYYYKIYFGMNGMPFYEPGSLNISFSSSYLAKAAGIINVFLRRFGGGTVSIQPPDARAILKRYFPESG